MEPCVLDYVKRAGVDELRRLNRLVVERLRLLAEEDAREGARAYLIGDAVEFEDQGGRSLGGRVVRINRKTVTVQTEGGSWRVHPRFLRPVLDLALPGSSPAVRSRVPRALQEGPGESAYASGAGGTPSAGRNPAADKISRNALCPCGSGKKYKHCCGR